MDYYIYVSALTQKNKVDLNGMLIDPAPYISHFQINDDVYWVFLGSFISFNPFKAATSKLKPRIFDWLVQSENSSNSSPFSFYFFFSTIMNIWNILNEQRKYLCVIHFPFQAHSSKLDLSRSHNRGRRP